MTKYVVFYYSACSVLTFVVSWMTLIYYNYPACGATMGLMAWLFEAVSKYFMSVV